MKKEKLIINASQLVVVKSDYGKPLRGKKQNNLEIIKDGALLICEGKIKDFGKSKILEKKYKTIEIIDADNRVVMPGFIDSHTHLIFAGKREDEFIMRLNGESYLDILNKGYGILSTVDQVRKSSKEELFNLAINRLFKLIQYGTTSVEIKSGYGLNFTDEIKILEVVSELKKKTKINIKATLMAAHAIPKEYVNIKKEYINLICEEIIPYVSKNNLADFVDVFCEEGVYDINETRKVLEAGIFWGLKPKLHADEFKAIGGVSLASELNAISVDHLIVSDPNELIKLNNNETIAVILPGTSFILNNDNKKYGRNIIDNNIPLAIATDFNPGTCMCYSMQMMIELSVIRLGITIEEAINGATINASFASGLQDYTGSIEIGKSADIIILDLENYKEIPYNWGINKILSIIINGEVVFKK